MAHLLQKEVAADRQDQNGGTSVSKRSGRSRSNSQAPNASGIGAARKRKILSYCDSNNAPKKAVPETRIDVEIARLHWILASTFTSLSCSISCRLTRDHLTLKLTKIESTKRRLWMRRSTALEVESWKHNSFEKVHRRKT